METFKEHPGEGGQVEIMQHTCDDRAQHLRLGLINPCKEEEVGQEEADGELQVEGGAGVLDGSTQEEGEGGQEQAQQRG